MSPEVVIEENGEEKHSVMKAKRKVFKKTGGSSDKSSKLKAGVSAGFKHLKFFCDLCRIILED